jgi:hypothetical protein
MLREFRRGSAELGEVWDICLQPDTSSEIRRLAAVPPKEQIFHMDDILWAKVVIEFSRAYRMNPILRTQLVRSLTPLYLGRVASFVMESEKLGSREVEEKIESLCLAFESLKPYLIGLWNGEPPQATHTNHPASGEPDGPGGQDTLEVRNV